MKHIKNLTTFFFMFILQIVLTITGWFVVPIGMLFMEHFQPLNITSRYKRQKRFKWKWFDNIFGNKEELPKFYRYSFTVSINPFKRFEK